MDSSRLCVCVHVKAYVCDVLETSLCTICGVYKCTEYMEGRGIHSANGMSGPQRGRRGKRKCGHKNMYFFFICLPQIACVYQFKQFIPILLHPAQKIRLICIEGVTEYHTLCLAHSPALHTIHVFIYNATDGQIVSVATQQGVWLP